MTRTVALVLLIAVPCHAADVDAGTLPAAVWAQRAQLQLSDGSWAESECFAGDDGGTDCSGGWLPKPTLLDDARVRVNLQAQNATLVATPPLFSTGTWVTMALLGALTVFFGGYIGFKVAAALYGH